jgi:hypothetical protein
VIYTWAFTWLDSLNLGTAGMIVISLQFIGTLAGHVGFGWVGDSLEARHGGRGRITLGLTGLILNVAAAAGLLLSGDQGLALLFVFGLLTGVTESLKMSGARAPLLQNILLPELRATGRGAVGMVVGLASSLFALFAGWLVTALGDNVALMMLFLVPIPKLFSIVAWIPLYRTYPRDLAQMHDALEHHREEIIEARGLL